jgi:hypothetical protein
MEGREQKRKGTKREKNDCPVGQYSVLYLILPSYNISVLNFLHISNAL